ncbi:DUF3693 domain-containing protein [Xanthomonas campestris pv. asclepiadis]|uniref:DUF3693 domain-containing protein n=1 Tax=Xanthomonas campestris TaxID=339 RepID=UPI001E3AA72C|nr:DUF3693 domain-containing protein [Xanthomonas campestris]MCC4615641.1 DUF3693 domain-containing protein [Xanthomonas campestris pv. asclepiadis]
MSQSYDLFCRWKHVQKIQSDNAGAIALGVTRAAVSSWKKGKNAEIQFIERMAEDIGDNPETWSALVMAERSNSEDERAAWKRIAQRLAGVTLGVFIALGAALPGRAEASINRAEHHISTDNNAHALYIMRSGLLTLLCALAAYQCWSLHRKRTGR